MVAFNDKHKLGGRQAVVAPPVVDEPEEDEEEEGLWLHCYMFLSLHGRSTALVRKCKRNLFLTEDDPSPLAHNWYYMGFGWLCPVCKIEADRAWERYKNRPVTLAQVKEIFG